MSSEFSTQIQKWLACGEDYIILYRDEIDAAAWEAYCGIVGCSPSTYKIAMGITTECVAADDEEEEE